MIKRKEQPNCEKCFWSIKLFFSAICKAQGHSDARVVYNNKVCMKLFQAKDED